MSTNQSTCTFKGSEITLSGALPAINSVAPNFTFVNPDLSETSLHDLKGKKILLNVFPSVDTSVCALQLKRFNEAVASKSDVVLLFVSLDLPFAFKRFCGVEGIENTITGSDFRYQELGASYGLKMENGPLQGLYARAVVLIDEDLKISYSEVVSEITNEPDYDKALNALG